ncbi:MAG: undecaprenyl-diphosphate phosphatase, partial [Campylobacteraceae bacterium]|nr:undecaprenyl-diphosphate phosphatase [Campylobacteraceae bacterium]
TGKKDEKNITLYIALLIGLAQMLALIPGVSRSGITLSAALLLGFSRVSAARFSFLLSIPIILLASGYEGLKLTQSVYDVEWIR